MKKIMIVLACCLAAVACKKNQTQCVRHITELSCDVAFAGFSTDELDTVVLTQYNANTGFSELLETDTIVIMSPQVKDGIVYRDTSSYRYKGFFTLKARNYKVYFPAINREYKITEVTSPPETDTFITTAEHCPMGTGAPWLAPASAIVNGIPASGIEPNANNFFIAIYR